MISIKLTGWALVLSMLTLVARAETPAADLSKENAELKAKVEKLERQVKELNRKLLETDRALQRATANAAANLEYGELLITPPAALPPTVRIPDPQRPTIPPNAVEHRFNGDVFYVIPCNTRISAANSDITTTIRQK